MDDINNIDVRNLEHSFMSVDAENMAQRTIIENLRLENQHLREVIDKLISICSR